MKLNLNTNAIEMLVLKGMNTYLDSPEWKDMERANSLFKNYDQATTESIIEQFPLATRVASKTVWARLQRTIIDGAEPIRLRGGAAYDISQTEGKPMPETSMASIPTSFSERIRQAAIHTIKETGFTLQYERMPDGTNGYTNYTHKIVGVNRRIQGSSMELKTLCHELGHVNHHGACGDEAELMASVAYSLCEKEIQAEAIAFLVCGAAGLDTLRYSMPYMLRWAKGDREAILDAIVGIDETAGTLIDSINSAIDKRLVIA